MHDLGLAARSIAKTPGPSFLTVGTLALGIGAATTVFALANEVLLKRPPYRDPDRLVLIQQRTPEVPLAMVAYPNFLDWQTSSRSFSGMAVYNRYASLNLTGAGQPERVAAGLVSSGFLDLLGVGPVLGRGFHADEHRQGAARSVLLGHGFWERRFGADGSVVGRTLTLDGTPYVVAGILPAGFAFPRGVDLLTPFEPFVDDGYRDRGNSNGLVALARLRAGVSLEEGRRDLETIARRLELAYPESNQGIGVAVRSLRDVSTRGARPVLNLLSLAAAMVLVVTAANAAALLTVRTLAQRRSLAVRAALGAPALRLVRYALTESLLLGTLGALLGLGLGVAGMAVVRYLDTGRLLRAPAGADGRVVAFALGLALVTSLVSGVLPALRGARLARTTGLCGVDAAGSSGGPFERRLRTVFIAVQVALSVVLLTGAALLLTSLARMRNVPPGFSPEGVLTARISVPARLYPTPADVSTFQQRLEERLASLPGTTAAGLVQPLPFSEDGWETSVRVEGYVPRADERVVVEASAFSPGARAALGASLVRGRDVAPADTASSMPVALVNEAFARRYWPGKDPIGKRVGRGSEEKDGPFMTVVGVVGDFKRGTLTEAEAPEVIMPLAQSPSSYTALLVRSSLPEEALPPLVRKAIQEIDPEQPVFGVRPLGSLLDATLESHRLTLGLLGGCALLALALAGTGLHGVLAQLVERRRLELGIRAAVGASGAALVALVTKESLGMVLLGAGAGHAIALLFGRLLRSFLFGVTLADPIVHLGVAATVLVVALAATSLPALRAACLDPVRALRGE